MEDYVRVRRMHFHRGMSVREIARRTGFHRKTVRKMIAQGSPPQHKSKGQRRHRKLDPFVPIIDEILRETRLEDRPVDLPTHRDSDRAPLRRALSRGPHRASAQASGLDPPASPAQSAPARRGADRAVENARRAPDKKNARRWGAHVVFIDESGFSLTPTVRGTWAPRGRHLSSTTSTTGAASQPSAPSASRPAVAACATSSTCGARRSTPRRSRSSCATCCAICAGGSSSSGTGWGRIARRPRRFAQSHPRLWVEWFPPYAPELNPVEWLWSWMKGVPLSGLCPDDVEALLDAIGDAHHQITAPLLDGILRGPEIPWN